MKLGGYFLSCVLLQMAVAESAHADEKPRFDESVEGAVPSWATVSVSDTKVEVHFSWKTPPSVPKDRAIEFSVILFDPYLEPVDGKDLDPTVNYESNLPDSYRDVYNHTAGSLSTIDEGLKTFCGYDVVKAGVWAAILAEAIKATLDTDKGVYQFAVGTRKPEKLIAGQEYYYKYFTKKKSVLGAKTYSYALVSHDSVNNTDCPLTTGDLKGYFGFGDGPPPKWLNRLCVPTAVFNFLPGNVTENICVSSSSQKDPVSTPSGIKVCAQCLDNDGDGWFSTQMIPDETGMSSVPALMMGTNVGDCDDSDSSVKSEKYSATTGLCGGCATNFDCGMARACREGTCIACAMSETGSCVDGLDNDCDGYADCLDPVGTLVTLATSPKCRLVEVIRTSFIVCVRSVFRNLE